MTAPEKTAVISGTRSLTYSRLEARSNQFAHFLLSRGRQPGDLIGLGLNRGIDLIIALLGILKIGAAYVPLDPSYPAARLEQMIASAGLEHVIHALEESELAAFPENPPVISTSGDQRIYAIFTSGSTGMPKAAAVYHRGFSNLIDWYRTELTLSPDDTALVISSPSFDLTQKNFYAPLVAGGTLVFDEESTYDITRISRLIRENHISLINCTPSAFYPLVDAAAADDFRDLSSLRYAVLGGEPISIPRLRAWLEHPDCQAEVMNSYGPTECTDICLIHRLHRGNLDDFPFVPLGHEIPNVQVTLRDENLQPVPDGEIGEICIGGVSLGEGYLNDPEKTTSRFIDGIYKTGDLGKRHACGTFEFRGRADYQVKVNGFRIELGEIELALGQHPGVREAVVIARENRLIAHIQGDAAVSALRDHLAARLPAYMIPAEFHFVETFPLTPNGKVDRKALTEISTPTSTFSNATTLEKSILALWSEVLGKPLHDATANFFDLGGNSIHLAVVHVRLVKMADRDFPITELFALPTARAIAAFLSPEQTAGTAPTAQDRARLAQAGFSRFRRPLPR
ncbi:MAG: non-ribosomal peptide synthetase [Luteolibacter sp.]